MTYTTLYLAAIVAANLIITAFGPEASVITAFLFVGFVMTTRDKLHDRWTGRGLPWRMALLVAAGGALSALFNIHALPIAIASTAAFVVSETVNALVYHPLLKRNVSWFKRVNAGNVPNAIADSFIFVTLAFGFLPGIILAQIAAKVLGGALWSLVIRSRRSVVVAAVLLFASATAAQAQPKPVVLVSAHYDVARQAPIASVVYQAPAPLGLNRVFVNGFVEGWRNSDVGYPANEVTLFSKHWVGYSLTPRLALSLEVEALYNRAGVAFRWPEHREFTPGDRTLYVTPKVGASYRIY